MSGCMCRSRVELHGDAGSRRIYTKSKPPTTGLPGNETKRQRLQYFDGRTRKGWLYQEKGLVDKETWDRICHIGHCGSLEL
jgi:hypothetical protein